MEAQPGIGTTGNRGEGEGVEAQPGIGTTGSSSTRRSAYSFSSSPQVKPLKDPAVHEHKKGQIWNK